MPARKGYHAPRRLRIRHRIYELKYQVPRGFRGDLANGRCGPVLPRRESTAAYRLARDGSRNDSTASCRDAASRSSGRSSLEIQARSLVCECALRVPKHLVKIGKPRDQTGRQLLTPSMHSCLTDRPSSSAASPSPGHSVRCKRTPAVSPASAMRWARGARVFAPPGVFARINRPMGPALPALCLPWWPEGACGRLLLRRWLCLIRLSVALHRVGFCPVIPAKRACNATQYSLHRRWVPKPRSKTGTGAQHWRLPSTLPLLTARLKTKPTAPRYGGYGPKVHGVKLFSHVCEPQFA